jgi:multiple sugar transport system substrate-binding protein
MQINWKSISTIALCVTSTAVFSQTGSTNYNWKAQSGKTVTFLSSNHPWANAVLKYKPEFETLTGITLKVDTYQEQQMRQRLVTVMNAKSDEVDVFMSLPSREGRQFQKAGWYADLKPFVAKAPADYAFNDFSPALVAAETHNSVLTGIPVNLEGPVLYYRKDLFQKCGVSLPATLGEMEGVLSKLKACDASVTPFVSRGLKGALPYTFSVFVNNNGADYLAAGKPALCSAPMKTAMAQYANTLKNFGPPGVANYNFYQISSLYKEGKAAIAFESSNEFRTIMEVAGRSKDTGIALLPAGPAGSKPTVIGWGVSLSNHSKNKDAAWMFVQWATSRDMQERLALEGIAPPRLSVARDPDFKKWIDAEPVRKEWITAVNTASKDGISKVGVPIVQNVASRDVIGQAINEILLGQKTIEQACADGDQALAGLLAKE